MDSRQYSVSADSRRWWWPSAAVGAVALATAVAIPVTAARSLSVDRPPTSTTATRASDVLMAVDVPEWACLQGRTSWNATAYGPRPSCAARQADRRIERPADCPPPPDARYVGVPWVPYEPTGCTSIDRWWTMTDPQPKR